MHTYDMGVTVSTQGDRHGDTVAVMVLVAQAVGLSTVVEPVRGWLGGVRKQRIVLTGTLEALERFKTAIGEMFPDTKQSYV